MTKKTVILTNHSLRYYAGSELTTFELAREFLRRDWDVYVACFELSPAIKDLFKPLGISWINLGEEQFPLTDCNVDLVWGHHFTTFDRLFAHHRIQSEKSVFVSLSPFEPLESPPIYANNLSAIGANSIENFNTLTQQGFPSERIFLFENSVSEDYFSLQPRKKSDYPCSIAVISNHVPNEIRELKGNIKQISIDFYGFEYQSVLITKEILSQYDLVITIGRTVQQCFSLEIPVYCYDRFGGPGYIDIYNFEKAAAYNFSGRCCRTKLGHVELINHLLSGYPSAVKNLSILREISIKRFCISDNLSNALNFIAPYSTKELPLEISSTIARQSLYHAKRENTQPAANSPAGSKFEESTRNVLKTEDQVKKSQPVNKQLHEYENYSTKKSSSARAVAFYLPQFHRIPENDQWWGDGFTEWDNVRQGKPLFDGHYQPHIPSELDYYNLDDISVLSNQAKLAREYGLEGFCFYYYWFDGKRLLEKPIDQMLAHPEIDLPFCLCWANENWTRRWDGGEREMLIEQSYSTDLNARFAEDLLPYFRNSRYIRINGRPVLLIYRTDIIPSLKNTIASWRQTWRDHGIGEVYLVCVESFTVSPPEANGFDASCEFLPHQVDFSSLPPFPYPQQLADRSARIGSYEKLVKQLCARPAPPYKRFRGVVPAWDNTARRRKGGATLFTGSSPELYEQWLAHAIRQTRINFEGEEQLLFINAWNEWGEGCHLEPDQRYGRAYLEATQRALSAPVDVDLHYERKLKPYLDWIASTAESFPRALPEHSLNRLVFVIDATASSARLADTMASLDACGTAGARRVLVASQQQATEQAEFIQSDCVSASLLSRISETAGAWLCILSPGDKVNPAAFHALAAALRESSVPGLIYTDHDLLDGQQRRHSPNLKPDPDPDLLYAADYIGRAVLMHSALLASPCVTADMLWPAILLTCSLEATRDSKARWQHVAEVAFHLADSRPPSLPVAQRAALLAAHFSRHGIHAEIQPGLAPESLRISYQHAERPLVSIIIPTRNQLGLLQRCIESCTEKSSYPHYELLIVDNNSDDPETLAYLQQLIDLGLDRLQIFSYPHPFNFAAMNNLAAKEARGEYLVLLNNDTAIIKGDWLEALLNHAQRPEVGAVGAKLLYPEGKIQHAGIILGLRGPAEHPFIGSPMQAEGYNQRLLLDQRYSAVTAACMMVRKSVYLEVGGMDEQAFAVSYNDVDLCLKIGSAGHAVVWTPHALVMHVGSVSQKAEDPGKDAAKRERFNKEKAAMYERWLPQLTRDPAYNPGLSLNGKGFELEANPLFQRNPGSPKLYALCGDQQGSGFYRIIAPCDQLVSAGLATGASSRIYLPPPCVAKAAPDVMIFQRQITDEQINSMQQYRKLIPAKMIFELDDYLPNLPLSSTHRKDMPPDILRNLRRAMALCDRVVVSTEPLKAAMHNLHPEIIVLPNYLPPAQWGSLPPRPPHNPARKPRVGWAGGAGHTGDLRLIREVVQALQDKVEWVFFGMIPEGVHPDSVECHIGVSLQDYPTSLAALDLDLALAPLEENRFNACKSNLRLLEYGICGYPVIASDAPPYRCGLPVTLVKNRFKDWVDAIEAKIADPDALRQEGLALQTVVRKTWMLKGENLARWQAGWLLGAT